MKIASTLRGGIIAAGEGRRLRQDGWSGSKAMARVAGKPLIDHALGRFAAAGIGRVTVIINEASEDCRQWLVAWRGDPELDVIVRTTPSSYASFKIVADRLAGARAVITTVDGVMPLRDFQEFVGAASALPDGAFALGLTSHVDDENPLWADVDPATGRICKLGESHGRYVTAGIYALPANRPAAPASSFERLRDYLRWLVDEGEPVHGIVLSKVFDIDRGRDIAQAEQALAGDNGQRGAR